MAAQAEDKVTIKGGCHCGHVRYTANIAPKYLESGIKCNCTFCNKLGTHGIPLNDPQQDVSLLAPADFPLVSASKSTAAAPSHGIGDYFTSHEANGDYGHRFFCQNCGVHIFMAAKFEHPPGTINDMFSVTHRSIDQPQDGVELSKIKFNYMDGLTGSFHLPPKDTPFAGGLI